MNKTRVIQLLLLLALLPIRGLSQTSSTPLVPYYYFSRYQISNGMPSNNVSCCVQDNYGFLWVGTGNGVCRYDGYHFTTVYDMMQYRTMGGAVEALFVDNEGFLWFATESGKGSYDPVSGEVRTVDIDSEEPVSSIFQDSEGYIWFCSSDLFRYDKGDGEIKKYPSGRFNFTCAVADSEGQVWCTSSDGRLLAYDSLVDRFKEENLSGLELVAPASGKRLLTASSDSKVYLYDPYKDSSIFLCEVPSKISSLLERSPGEYWIGTRSGIFIYMEETGMTVSNVHSDSEAMSLSSDDIVCLNTDREGNVWAGTPFNGLNLWRNNDAAYSIFYPISKEASIAGTNFHAVCVSHNRVWAGTEDGELNYLPAGGTFFHQINIPGERNDYHHIMPVGDEIWICTHGNGIFRLDIRTSTVIGHYQFDKGQFHRMTRTSSGDILAGSSDGVYRYIRETDSFEHIQGTEGIEVVALSEDSHGCIWLGTTSNGIILLNRSFQEVESLEPKTRITSLFEDSRRRMWATTDGDGVLVLDINSLEPYHLSKENGFPNSVACSTVEDKDGMIWIATSRGLHLIDPDDFHVVSSFFMNDDNQSLQFTHGAVSTSSTERIFMGTTYGLLSFLPSKMKSVEMDKSIYISSIKGIVGDRVTDLSEEGYSALHSRRIVAKYKDASSLRIRFSCNNFASPVSYQYRYTLSSRKGSVSEVSGVRMALLFNVGYGKHLFTVSLVGSDATESTRSVEIIIRRPFYKSTFAICMTVLFLLSLFAALIYNITKWRKKERMLRQERIDRERQRELYESKNAFFMNITHEIRTPLSLIKMPLDHMIQTGEYSKKDLLVIQANTNRLLELINQLLDIRKLEQNEEKLEFTRYDICEIVRRTTALFNTTAEDQGVKLNVSTPESRIEAMCARDSIEKIISNLITNALKYGKDSINVSLVENDGTAILRVDSNGERIPARNKEKIFDKFVHGGKGTGLGLPLARTLAEQHGGKLYLDVSCIDCNSFVLEIPLVQPETISMEATAMAQSVDEEPFYNDSRRDILVVEDNEDFRLYLAESLSKDFNVFTATNGKAAADKLVNRKLDLVISDVMMPVMDGCDLCNYIKTTVEFSHIPVILLTAAVGMETRLATLEVGADGYIEKPFPIELLLATINNLFKNREIAYQQFSKSPLSHFNGASANKMDEDLMSRLHALLLEKMSDSALSINDLSSALNISNSTLFRKIKANTGLNINEYIRLSRLKRAAELLASGKYRVNEVADMVGFSSASYFSSNFQKQFNVSPSTFVKNLNSGKS